MSLPSGGRPDRGPHVGISLDIFHSATSVGLPPYLEGTARSVALDSSYDPVRLHTPIWGFCPAIGSLFSSAQRSNRRGILIGSTPRLLQPVFSCSEKGWGFASHTRSAQAELLPLQREIQDADAQEHSFLGPRGGLVRHGQPEGCLLPHPGGSEAQEVPQVRLWGKDLPVQGSSLWASSGPKDIHQVYGCSFGPAEAPEHPNPQLPGRLAYFSQLQGAGDLSLALSPSPP